MAELPTVGALGILPRVRATLFRIRAALPRPRYEEQAKRVDVRDAAGVSLALEYLTTFSIGEVYAELYCFKKNNDIQALMSIYFDEATSEYVFGVSRNVWDALDVLFDAVLIGTAPTFPAVTADMVVSLGYVTFRAAPPT